MAADVPAYPDAYTALTVSEASDAGGTLADVLGKHNNKHDERIAAISADLIAAFTVSGAVDITALVTAMLAGHTDGHVRIDGSDWVDGNGVISAADWEHSSPSSGTSFVRFVKSGTGRARAAIPLEGRDATDRGSRVQTIELVYSIGIAAIFVDISVNVGRTTFNGDGVAPTLTVIPVTFDANHNTNIKRSAQAEHTMTITITTPFFLAKRDGLFLSVTVDDTGGGTSEFELHGADVFFDRVSINGV